MAAIAYALLSQHLEKKYMVFFPSSKSNKFIECWQPQQRFSSVENATYVCVCFLLSLPSPNRLSFCCFFSFLCVTLCGIRFMRCTELYHIVHSNNKQTQLMFTIRLMWRKKNCNIFINFFYTLYFMVNAASAFKTTNKRIEIKK